MNDYDEILVALRRITRAIDLHSKKLVKETGLTTSQLIILLAIAKLGCPSASAIAREVVLSQATVTSILDRLEKKDYVLRTKAEDDKRVVNVQLTSAGEQKIQDSPELLQADFLRKYRKLVEWQRHMLIASLQQIASMMDAEELDASPVLEVGDLEKNQ